MEKTWKFTQNQLREEVDIQTADKIFDLNLEKMGPYVIDYTRNGRFLLIGGKKGHLALMEWATKKSFAEIQLTESIRDVKFLQNETMYAVAQKKYTYIYDKNGVEMHCLKKHIDVLKLEFLPYHWLLASVGNAGWLKYQDVSTGSLVVELRTKLGRCDTMKQNPTNAVISLGHYNGIVTLWSPNLSQPLVKMLCHRGPVKAIAYSPTGFEMVTSGLDGQLKIWDLRTYKMIHSYYSVPPASCIDVSQTGMLGLAHGARVQVWKDAIKTKQISPYMNHLIAGAELVDLHFCPFEDFLGIGHSKGFSSIVIPGSGEPNFDTFEANPYQTKKQRQEGEVRSLLEKLRPEMITLDPTVLGTVDRAPQEVIEKERQIAYEANHPGKVYKEKKKRQKIGRKLKRKQQNVWDEKRETIAKETEQKQKEKIKAERQRKGLIDKTSVLDRFKKKHSSVKDYD